MSAIAGAVLMIAGFLFLPSPAGYVLIFTGGLLIGAALGESS